MERRTTSEYKFKIIGLRYPMFKNAKCRIISFDKKTEVAEVGIENLDGSETRYKIPIHNLVSINFGCTTYLAFNT